jgi:hypothetical protein
MPRTTERAQLLEGLETILRFKIAARALELSDTDSSNSDSSWDSDDGEDDFLAMYNAVRSSRYLDHRSRIPTSDDFYQRILHAYDDTRFKRTLRLTRATFARVLSLIKDHDVFKNESNNEQMETKKQLAVTLYRFGHYGNGASVLDVASTFGIGEGTIILITKRVVTAILSLAPQFIVWPTAEERREHALKIERLSGFPNVVGCLDGTDIGIYKTPGLQGETYFNRKKRYAISCQVICSYDKKILHVFTGYPGSVHDARVYRSMRPYRFPEEYFSGDEYLLADSAYELSAHCIVPYRKPASNIKKNRQFNYYLSNIRVCVEHTIGIWKERFPSLKALRVNLYRRADHKAAVEWIDATAVLHNIAQQENDVWEYDEMQNETNDSGEQNNSNDSRSGVEKRKMLQELVLFRNRESN